MNRPYRQESHALAASEPDRLPRRHSPYRLRPAAEGLEPRINLDAGPTLPPAHLLALCGPRVGTRPHAVVLEHLSHGGGPNAALVAARHAGALGHARIARIARIGRPRDIQGFQGIQGEVQGFQGLQGLQGEVGPPGPQGPVGPQRPAGEGFQKFAADLTASGEGGYIVNHSLGTRDVLVSVYDRDTDLVYPLGGSVLERLYILDQDRIQVDVAQAGNYRVVILG